jgi:protein-L-isoaspartate O-methyltransferase
VNRADFIPDVIWVHRGAGSSMYPLSRVDDPETWSKVVNSDNWIVTQVDDGELEDGKGTFPTSSSSAPPVMKEMLDLLDVHEGMDVLEVGAGTGYNAALIAEKVLPGHVTTVEVDRGIAEHARSVLGKTSLPVTVITGDGTLGHPGNAPYDRVMCTAAALLVPYAWVEQTRLGGKIVVPLVGSFRRAAFLCLTVGGDGTAQGRFHGGASFMRLRNQRDDEPLWRVWSPESAEYYDEDPEDVQITTTGAYHPEPFTDFDAGFAFGARLPGWIAGRRVMDGILLMSHSASGSWATVLPGDDEHKVYYEGPRRLWEELEAAHQWWIDAGKPDHTRFGVTVTPDTQTFWLDTPDQVTSAS